MSETNKINNTENFKNTKIVKKINLDYIYDSKQIKKRCKFIINNINSINAYEVKLQDVYWKKTFYYNTKDLVVNFYGKRANDIMERAIASTLSKIEQVS